ncbi:GyrI-like domain-containing protein [bacterium]|nr:GyrI-like domain-containing protein [bacterium]
MYRMQVTRVFMALLAGAVVSLAMGSAALAQHEGHEMHGGGMAAMDEAGPCPGCGMSGGLCAGCEPMAMEILNNMAVGMCPDCDDPDALCEKCSAAVEGAMGMMNHMNPREMDGPEHTMVCLATTIGGDFGAAYGQLFELGEAQGLMGENMMTGSVLPDAAADVTGESAIYVSFSMPEGGAPQDPLFAYTVPANEYAVFRHFGPDPGMTWMAAYTWLALGGVEVQHAPAGEHHMGPPDADGNMTMDIFIPVDDDALEAILGDDGDEMDDDDDMDMDDDDDDDDD